MNAMTDEEVTRFENQHHWATGLNIAEDGRGLYYDTPEANCIELKFPEKPMQVPYFTRVLSLLNTESEEHFNGALLWITLSTIGSPQLEKIGWKLVEKMRLAFGETRPLGVAPGHWFRSDEFVELKRLLASLFHIWMGRVFGTLGEGLLRTHQPRRVLDGCHENNCRTQRSHGATKVLRSSTPTSQMFGKILP